MLSEIELESRKKFLHRLPQNKDINRDRKKSLLPRKRNPAISIRAIIFVEKESHRRIIIGRQGNLIKAIGTQARRELEQILGARIFLDLWVKVKENWRDSADVLDLIESQ